MQGECLKEDAEVVQSAAVQVVLEVGSTASILGFGFVYRGWGSMFSPSGPLEDPRCMPHSRVGAAKAPEALLCVFA